MLRDLRIALRTLWRQPSFTIVAVAILALGVGATTAMYSLMNALLLRPLPYPDSGHLVRVYRTSREHRTWPHSLPNFRDQRTQNTVFSGMAAFSWRSYSLSEAGVPAERLTGMAVTADFFPLLEVKPALGRLFLPEEDRYQHNQVAVLSHEAWTHRFGGDPQIIGRTLRLDGESVTVVGVMGPEFSQPVLWTRIDLWRPAGLLADAPENERGNNYLQAIARLKPGVAVEGAEAELNVIAARLDQLAPGTGGIRLLPLHLSGMDEVGGRVAWLTMGLAVFVLLIACINLAGIQLTRLAARDHEYAIRAALGASRGWLVRQSLLESLPLSVAGGLVGTLVAESCTELIGARLVIGGGTGVDIPLDGGVLAFAVALVVFTSLAVGAVPALLSGRVAVYDALRQGGRGSTDKSRPRLRQGLVVAEMALALVLLAAGGLFLRGLGRFVDRDLGWQVDGLLTGRVNLASARYRTDAARQAFYEQLEKKLAALPGVDHGAIAWALPVTDFASNGSFIIEGEPWLPPGQAPLRDRNGVTPDYFRTLGMTLREGRAFAVTDGPDAPPVAIINESLARRYWPNGSAIGKRVGEDNQPDPPTWRTIVGVVSDVRFPARLNQPVTPYQCYFPLAQDPSVGAYIALRAKGEPGPLANALRQAVAELDTELPVFGVSTVREVAQRTLINFSLIGWILVCFAILGLLLSALGVYGLFSGFVVQRTREIGLRVALGALRWQVLWLVLSKGLRLALFGALLGVTGALAVAPVLTAAAAALPANDPLAVVLLAALLVAVALFACWLPARRAAALDPMIALRYE